MARCRSAPTWANGMALTWWNSFENAVETLDELEKRPEIVNNLDG
jgi:hypothetical protein